MAYSALTAHHRAYQARGSYCQPGYCLRYTRGWYGIPSKYGRADTAWFNAIGKHYTSSGIPVGAPVFWVGGSAGHIAIMSTGGYIISTDAPTNSRIGMVPLSWPAQRWGLRFAGWAEGFNGVRIPGLGGAVAPPPPADTRPTVSCANLHYGAKNADVIDLQRALNAHKLAAPGNITLPLTGYYGDKTDTVVRACQRQHGYGSDGYHRSFVGARQAVHLGLRPV